MTSYAERSTQETDVYIPSLKDMAQRAYDSYLGAFLDWDVVEWQKYPDKAFDYYMAHLYGMQSNKGWPPQLIQILRENALQALAQSTTAEQFWSIIKNSEMSIIITFGYDPSTLQNWTNHVRFLDSVGDAATGYREVLQEFSPHNMAKKAADDTADDYKKLLLAGFGILIVLQITK